MFFPRKHKETWKSLRKLLAILPTGRVRRKYLDLELMFLTSKVKKLLPGSEVYPTGSRYVCNPPVTNTDVDFVVFHEMTPNVVLQLQGFLPSDPGRYPIYATADWVRFRCWRRGRINLIVSDSRKFVDTFVTGTHICKKFNLTEKRARVITMDAMRGIYGDYSPYLGDELHSLLTKMTGRHGEAIYCAYRIHHGLEGSDDS